MKLPALWFEGDYDPSTVSLGYLVDANDEGEAIVESATRGREALVPSEHLVLRVRCPRCGEWSAHVTPDGEHLVGCLEASGGA